ncbi:MAG: hypothetical protein Q9202_003328 [Teloschistes flavicans]
MEAVGLAASIVQLIDLTTKAIKYLNSVKRSSKERTELSLEASSLLQFLLDLQNKVDQSNGTESWFHGLKSLDLENGPLDQLRGALQQLAKRLKPKKGIKDATSAFTWNLNKGYCMEVLNTIERVKSRITLALVGDTFKVGQAIKEDTARIGTVDERVSALSLGIDGIHHKGDLEKRREILKWLSPLNFYQVQQDISTRRQADTGQWFLDAPEFQKWVSGTDNTLCCPGMPGAGKSVLASLAVDFLRRLPKNDPPIGVAAVFCSFKDQEQQSLENLLASVCVQLLQESSSLPGKLMDLYETHYSKGTRPGLQEILHVFQVAVNAIGLVYLVVDALDECMEEVRNELISNIKATPVNLQLLVTTRYIDSILSHFTASLQLEVRANDADLDSYIRSKIQRLPIQVQAELADEICHSIITKADGMFLAAKLHMDSLATKASVKTLKQAVRNLSGTLDDLYDNAMQRVHATPSPEFRVLAEKALHWVAFTYRPLRVKKLLVALAIEPGEECFDPDGCPSVGLVLDICAGLLILDEQSEVVRLVHYTLQDYFNAPAETRYRDGHRFIARACMTYLNFRCVQGHPNRWAGSENSSIYTDKGKKIKEGVEDTSINNDCIDDSATWCEFSRRAEHLQVYELSAYAYTFWSLHAKAGPDAKLWKEVHEFLACGRTVAFQSPSMYDKQWRGRTPIDPVLCHGVGIAALFGLCEVLERLLRDTGNIDELAYDKSPSSSISTIKWSASALHFAAWNDQLAAVEMLLEHGADINCEDTQSFTPLYHAVVSESQSVAYALVARGASVVARSSLPGTYRQLIKRDGELRYYYQGSTLLGLVEWDAPLQFLQLLVDAGVYITPQDVFFISPLMLALIEKNDLKTAKWLLDGMTPLMTPFQFNAYLCSKEALLYSSSHGSVAFMKLLLEYGADIDSGLPSVYGTALHSVLDSDCDEIKVKLLLEGGIKVDAKDGMHGETALHRAARRNLIVIAKLLLESHATIDERLECGYTPLIKAISCGSTDIAKFLLRNGANPDPRDNHGATALHLASLGGNAIMVRELIKTSIDINLRSGFTLTVENNRAGSFSWYTKSYMTKVVVLDGTGATVGVLVVPSPIDVRASLYPSAEWLRVDRIHPFKIWKGGMTALDIAEFAKHQEIVDILKPRTTVVTEVVKTTWEDFLCELFQLSSIDEVGKELERRSLVGADGRLNGRTIGQLGEESHDDTGEKHSTVIHQHLTKRSA